MIANRLSPPPAVVLANDYPANGSIDFDHVAIKFNFLAMPDFAAFSVFDFSIDGDTPIFNGIFCNTTCNAQA